MKRVKSAVITGASFAVFMLAMQAATGQWVPFGSVVIVLVASTLAEVCAEVFA